MLIAVTGATGFLGRYIVNQLVDAGYRCRCWYRPTSDRGGFRENADIEWIEGGLTDETAADRLVDGADAVVHAALMRPGRGFMGAEGDLVQFAQVNIMGSLRLMQAARRANVERFVFISTCAVHDVILQDRPLDEAHPLWPKSHYGAHKAALEAFVHSFGLGDGWPICALRPTGIYGIARPIEQSKWYALVRNVVAGQGGASAAGGKEVHVSDVARAVRLLLEADKDRITGQSFNCYDMYVSEEHVARLAARIAGVDLEIPSHNKGPKNQIDTSKIRALGMTFGGEPLLEKTIAELVEAARR